LSGSEKIKLLKLLPEKLSQSDVLHENTKKNVVKLWQDFYELYLVITSACNNCVGSDIFEKVKVWLSDFLNLGQYRKGFF